MGCRQSFDREHPSPVFDEVLPEGGWRELDRVTQQRGFDDPPECTVVEVSTSLVQAVCDLFIKPCLPGFDISIDFFTRLYQAAFENAVKPFAPG
jgi:hypothetical protein